MIPQTYGLASSAFREAFRHARQHKPLDDSLESIAATIALQDRQRQDAIGAAFRFAQELKGDLYALKAERLAEIRSRRKARKVPTIAEMLRELAQNMVDSEEVESEPEIDEISAEFDSVYEDR